MNYIKGLVSILTLLMSMPLVAFEFNNSSVTYDFTQTVEIYIVDQKNSKVFAMRDPFEMTMTTSPSRYYVTLMGVLMRGHENGEGVAEVSGPASGYEYVLIFKSLNSAQVLFVGKNWIQDGNKKILLTPEETSALYAILLRRADSVDRMDLDKWELFFQEVNELQEAKDLVPSLSAEEELKSMMEAKKLLEQRLPESHDDMNTLPYYNKAQENRKFLEDLKAQQSAAPSSMGAQTPAEIQDQSGAINNTQMRSADSAPINHTKKSLSEPVAPPTSIIAPKVEVTETGSRSVLLWLVSTISLGLLGWLVFRKNRV